PTRDAYRRGARLACSFCVNDTAPTETSTLSLHDALPIFLRIWDAQLLADVLEKIPRRELRIEDQRDLGLLGKLLEEAADQRRLADRKSTRLNSSHVKISYAVFCLKKKNKLNALLTRVLHG